MKKISALFSLLYFVSLVASFYTLYQLPTYLVKSQAVDLVQLESAQSVFYQLNAILAVSFIIGGAALVCLWLESRSNLAVLPDSALEESVMALATDDPETDEDDGEIALVEDDDFSNHEGDDKVVFEQALSLLCKKTEASLAAAYRTQHTEEYAYLELFASYAYPIPEGDSISYRFGEGLAGQVAKRGDGIIVEEVPEGYIKIISGLGGATPTYLMIHPLKYDEKVVGVVEIASFAKFSARQTAYAEAVLNRLALKLANTDNVSLEEATR